MGKDKIKRFAENETFRCVIQPEFQDIFHKDHPLKGRWRDAFFGNKNPVILELGCGRGEYTIALAEQFPNKNFIGVDIKGARLWRGAKTATLNKMGNVAFLRTRIEFIDSFFGSEEVDEIWITFPDPQPQKNRVKKRLTAPSFLNLYAQFLKTEGTIHLKTDSYLLHQYTAAIAKGNNIPIMACCNDIYGSGYADPILAIKTTYEQQFLRQGAKITYLKFQLGDKTQFETTDDDLQHSLSIDG